MRTTPLTIIGSALVFVQAAVSLGQEATRPVSVPGEIFCDDFSDGSFTDASPVTWELGNTHDATRIEDGDLVIEGRVFPFAMPKDGAMPSDGWLVGDVSIRTQVRLLDGAGIARWNW